MMNASDREKQNAVMTSGKWYSEGLRFTCEQCGACCSGEPGFVWVTTAEIEKISHYLKITAEEFSRKYIRQAGAGYSLKERLNGNCIFLLKEGCMIYPARPLQCRTWPFWESNLTSKRAWKDCAESCLGVRNGGRLYRQSDIQRILMKHKK